MPITERGRIATATLDERGRVVRGTLTERGQAVFGTSASSSVLVSDSFNRADTTASSTGLGNTDSAYGGTSKTWTAAGGATPQILSNQAKILGSADSTLVVDTGQADNLTVSTVFIAINQAPQLVVRWASATSYIFVAPQGGTYQLWRRNGGWTQIGSGGTPVDGDTVKIELAGSTIKVYQNSTLLYSVTETFNQTSTIHGFGNGGGQPRFDDFKVQTLSTGGTNATINAVTATTTSTALAPSVTAQQNVSIIDTVATITMQAIAPSVSRSSNVSGISATSTAQAISPVVLAQTQINISSTVASLTTQAIPPTISNNINASITSPAATSTVNGVIPTLSLGTKVTATVTNPSVMNAIPPLVGSVTLIQAVTSTSSTQAISPTITANKQATISGVTATSNLTSLNPIITATQPNVTILAVKASSTSAANAPTIIIDANITVISATSSSLAKVPAVSTVGAVNVSGTAAAMTENAMAPVIIANRSISVSAVKASLSLDAKIPVIILNVPTIIKSVHLKGTRELEVTLKGARALEVTLKGRRSLIVQLKGGITMAEVQQNFDLYTGESKDIFLDMVKEDGSVMDLSGATVKWVLKRYAVSNTTESLKDSKTIGGIVVTNPSLGKITISITPADTSSLKPGTHYHEVKVTDALGKVSTMATGEVTVYQSGI